MRRWDDQLPVGKGRHAEEAAVRVLERRGYRVIDRNVRIGRVGEVDVLAMDGSTLVFIEVKAGSQGSSPFERVDSRKQRRLSRVARLIIANRRWRGDVRFDVVSIIVRDDGLLDVAIVRGAFEEVELRP